MSDMITLQGIVGTKPVHRVTGAGLAITDFRLASSQRRFNRTTGAWESADTNWYTISAYRELAINIATSINSGEHVVVTGRLRVKTWEKDGRKGTNVEVDADAVGHDLRWYTTAAVPAIRTGAGYAAGASSTRDVTDTARSDGAGSSGFVPQGEIGGGRDAYDGTAEFDETGEFDDDADDDADTDGSSKRADGFLPSGSGGFATLDS